MVKIVVGFSVLGAGFYILYQAYLKVNEFSPLLGDAILLVLTAQLVFVLAKAMFES